MNKPTTSLVALASLWLFPSFAAFAAPADNLDRALLGQAKKIEKHLRERGCKNVGVLKFLVRKGSKGLLTDKAGPLNLRLARRLELALILKVRDDGKLGIIKDASDTAASLKDANHLTPEGRKKLFQGLYPLAWGKQKVTADAFLTGTAEVDDDLQRMTVKVLCFGDKGEPVTVAEFQADTSVTDLVELGENFQLRGGGDEDKLEIRDKKRAKEAARDSVGRETHPFDPRQQKKSLVELEVLYNGRKQALQFDRKEARLPEPRAGQKVVLVLKRTAAAGKDRLGAVLKVNGQNTLNREQRADHLCTKWLLEAKDGPLTIEGFQVDGKTAAAFKVKSRTELEAGTIYGSDLGTISLTVFRERKAAERTVGGGQEEEGDFTRRGGEILADSVYPPKQPETLGALRNQLRGGMGVRGLIDQGERISSPVRRVPFLSEKEPDQSASIRYFDPGRNK